MRDLQERRSVVAPVGAWGQRLAIPAVAAAVVALDQITKTLALDHLNPDHPSHVVGPVYLELTYNSGAAFSMGAGVTPIVEAAVVVLIVGLLLYVRRASGRAPLPVAIGLGMLLGGALSNLVDRVLRDLPVHGSVVDFVRAVSWWPVFNVADSAIVIGVILLALTWRTVA